jgi:hypothetical protein
MRNNVLRSGLIIVLCQTLAYAPILRADQLSLPSGDLVAPEIKQDKYVDTVKVGVDHPISVKVTDNVGVKQVTLYYRAIGTEEYKRKGMTRVGKTDEYKTTISSDLITPPGVEYYIQAMDYAGNTVLYGYSFSPLAVKTVSADTAVATTSSSTAVKSEESSSNKWLWIGLGAAAVALAAGGGGGGGGGGTPTATLNINASDPTQ